MGRRFSGNPEMLRNERRRRILPLEIFEREVLERLRFKEIAIDYGAGAGYFIIPLSKHFRKVYAIEANREMAEFLKNELEGIGIENVEIILSERPPEFDFEIDFVLFSNVLHELEDYRKFLEWSSNSKSVCVIEWRKDAETEFGPPSSERIEEEEMVKSMREFFSTVRTLKIYPYHYTIIGCHEEGCME